MIVAHRHHIARLDRAFVNYAAPTIANPTGTNYNSVSQPGPQRGVNTFQSTIVNPGQCEIGDYPSDEVDFGIDDTQYNSDDTIQSGGQQGEVLHEQTSRSMHSASYLGAVQSAKMFMTLVPGHLYLLPSSSSGMLKLSFKGKSAHVFRGLFAFQDPSTHEVYYCTRCYNNGRYIVAKALFEGRMPFSSYREFESLCTDSDCYHVRAVKSLTTNDIRPHHGTFTTICPCIQFVLDKDEHGIVCASVASKADPFDRVVIQAVGVGVWECTSCSTTRTCHHVVCWKEFSQALDVADVVQYDSEWCSPPAVFEKEAHTIEDKDIIPTTPQAISLVKSTRGFDLLEFMPDNYCVPANAAVACPCGLPFALSGTWITSPIAVFGMTCQKVAKVQIVLCEGDGCTKQYCGSGAQQGIVRITPSTYFDIDLCSFIRLSLMDGPTSLRGVWRTLTSFYATISEVFCPWTTFLHGCWKVLSRVNLDLHEGMNCPHCGSIDTAPILIGDGTKLACRADLAGGAPSYPTSSDVGTEVTISDRLAIRSKPARDLLRHFVGYPKSVKSMSANQHSQLLALLHSDSATIFLYGLVKQLIDLSGATGLCDPVWVDFLYDLSSTSVVPNGLIHEPETAMLILAQLANHHCLNIDDAVTLQGLMPTLFKALQTSQLLRNANHVMWRSLSPVFLRLVEMCDYLSRIPAHEKEANNVQFAEPTVGDDDLSSCFPGAPCVRPLRQYSRKPRDKICTKLAPGSKYKLPGIFHFVCPHSICLGFTLMYDFESPFHPFSILAQRLKRHDGKRYVIIDNACNIQNYCMLREPWIFRNIWFLVDRLHYSNHKNCSSGYCIDNFPQLEKISSVLAEVYNSQLSSIVGSCGYMAKGNFMLYTKHYMTNINKGRLASIKKAVKTRSSHEAAIWEDVNAFISKIQANVIHRTTEVPCSPNKKCDLCSQ
ncbi:hypothetical protein AaE_016303 [Aphanomyces astaci]|uniref:Uncharacterized protein n=1 Tax=Aphanomyces astaci TaxID=112090 RepID=A0A6A4YWZ8_APHAT|nr:hypothetical protein AaE_016303 [Aphanomyces astaci]